MCSTRMEMTKFPFEDELAARPRVQVKLGLNVRRAEVER